MIERLSTKVTEISIYIILYIPYRNTKIRTKFKKKNVQIKFDRIYWYESSNRKTRICTGQWWEWAAFKNENEFEKVVEYVGCASFVLALCQVQYAHCVTINEKGHIQPSNPLELQCSLVTLHRFWFYPHFSSPFYV